MKHKRETTSKGRAVYRLTAFRDSDIDRAYAYKDEILFFTKGKRIATTGPNQFEERVYSLRYSELREIRHLIRRLEAEG